MCSDINVNIHYIRLQSRRADAYLYVVCSWLEGDGVDVSQFPAISRFMDAMAARPSVRAVRDAGMLT